MNLESEILEIKRTLQRIDSKQTALLNKEPKPSWVKASTIIELTGWNRERMRRARQNGEVVYQKKPGGIFYDLNSLHPLLIKKAI